MATAPNHGAIPKGDNAAHPVGYVQSADPGAIGADRPWCNTTDAASGHFTFEIRKSDDSGWLTANATHLGGTAAASYALLASPALTGTPTAPTATAGTNTTQLATTAFVTTAVAAVSGGSGGATINDETGTTYTLVLGDANNVVACDNASAITVTIPPNSSVAFPVGAKVAILQAGAGQVTVAGDTGVTLNTGAGGTLKTAEQYAIVEALQVAADEWVLYGDREAAP